MRPCSQQLTMWRTRIHQEWHHNATTNHKSNKYQRSAMTTCGPNSPSKQTLNIIYCNSTLDMYTHTHTHTNSQHVMHNDTYVQLESTLSLLLLYTVYIAH